MIYSQKPRCSAISSRLRGRDSGDDFVTDKHSELNKVYDKDNYI